MTLRGVRAVGLEAGRWAALERRWFVPQEWLPAVRAFWAVGCCRPSGAGNGLSKSLPHCPFAPLGAVETWAVRSLGRAGGHRGLTRSPWPLRAERAAFGQSHVREDTKLWRQRLFQRRMGATPLSLGNGPMIPVTFCGCSFLLQQGVLLCPGR